MQVYTYKDWNINNWKLAICEYFKMDNIQTTIFQNNFKKIKLFWFTTLVIFTTWMTTLEISVITLTKSLM